MASLAHWYRADRRLGGETETVNHGHDDEAVEEHMRARGWVRCDSREQAARFALSCFRPEGYGGEDSARDLEWLRAGGDPTQDYNHPVTGRLVFNQHCLHLAANEGDAGLVAELIRAGAVVDAETHPRLDPDSDDEMGHGDRQRPLTYACHRGHADVVKILIANGADVNKGTTVYDKALWFAQSEHLQSPDKVGGCRRIFRMLFRAGATIPKCGESGFSSYPSCIPTDLRWVTRMLDAGGFAAYEAKHRAQLLTIATKFLGPRLPEDVKSHVVAFWAHAGEY